MNLHPNTPTGTDPLNEEERLMVNDCIARVRKMSPADAAFIDNVRSQSYPLTSPQRQWLDDLWERVT